MTRSPRLPDYTAGLTPRQEQVLALLPTWLSAAEIGAKLGISKNTAKTHISAIYRKLGVSCRREAIQVAAENTTILDMALTWIKSSLSTADDRVNCVEAAHLPDGGVVVRSSRRPGLELHFTGDEWDCFVGGVKQGEFDPFTRELPVTWPGDQSEPYDPHAILASDLAHEIHRVYAAINIRVLEHQETWAKCAFCGEPYQLTEKWSDATVCCQAHHAAFAASIEAELAGMPDLFDVPDPGERGRPGANELRMGDAGGDGWDR